MKLILSILFSMTCLGFFAQKDSVYRNLHEALKNPLEVYQLFLYNASDEQDYSKLSEFKNLESLSIMASGLKTFPESIYSSKKLKKLDLRMNYGLVIDERIQHLTELKELSIPIIDSFQNFENTIGKLVKLEKLVLITGTFDICEVLVLSKLKELTIEYWSEEYFQMPNCSFRALQLRNVSIRTVDCCWPYLKTSSEKIQQMQSLLPIGCKLYGLSTRETLSDVNLR